MCKIKPKVKVDSLKIIKMIIKTFGKTDHEKREGTSNQHEEKKRHHYRSYRYYKDHIRKL